MMHGCTEPSSTLHPYAFEIAPHKITDPIGANANAKITTSTSKYQIHGNLLCGLLLMPAISIRRISFAERTHVAGSSSKAR